MLKSQINDKNNYQDISKKKITRNNIEQIDEYAFSYTSLNKFDNVCENLSYIGQGCFMHCPKLASINLTCNINCIYSNTFLNCSSLSEIIFPPLLENIENSAFKLCLSLHHIELPDTVTEIGDTIPAAAPYHFICIYAMLKIRIFEFPTESFKNWTIDICIVFKTYNSICFSAKN
mgnify:CR=1 FL=1